MTLQSSFDLDIFIKITTRTSQTIIDARGLEEIFGLLQYSILALIASFLTIIDTRISEMTSWLDEPMTWLKIAIYFSFSFGRELCKELATFAI